MSKSLSRRERQAALRHQQQRQRFVWGLLGLGVVLVLGAAIWSLSDRAVPDIDPFDAEVVALGRQVYDVQCAACHGADLEGEANWQELGPGGLLKGPPHDETGHTWHHDDTYLIESIKLGGPRLPADVGISPMPAYDDILTDEEITAVLSFIKSRWPADILAAQSQR